MSQLGFAFDLPPRFGDDDFLVSAANVDAYEAIGRWRDWPGNILLLIGPPASGKSHLAQVWAERTGAVRFPGWRGFDPSWRRAAAGAGVIDGADGPGLPEDALFHFLNLRREGHAPLLITAREPPGLWRLRTPDLLSRLRQVASVAIAPPDDALVRAVLVKLFADRQVRVEAGLIDYLALRIDRSLDAARRAVDMLDKAALDSGRRITRTAAAEILHHLRLDGD